MKLARYGLPGEERPALVDSEGRLRELSAHIPDITGATLALTVAAPRPAQADGLISFEVSAASRGVQAFDDDGTGARTAGESSSPEKI